MNDSIEIRKVNTTDTHLFNQIVQIRKTVFVEEQNVSPEEEFDEFEEVSKHYLLLVDGESIATARWRYIDSKIKCERFALLKAYRNNGYGSNLLKQVIDDVKEKSNIIYLHAQLKAIPFYERQGFQKVGEQFSECDILHYKIHDCCLHHS